MRQAVILAGGKGTRLRERLGGRPKPLVDICGRPLLERQLLLLRQGGCAHVVVLVSHAADQVRAFLAGRDWGLRVDCVDDGTALGTAGAVLAARGRLDAEFLVLYGDVMLEVDLARFESFHRAEPAAAATLFLHPNDHPHDSDLVETDGAGRIVAFHPCPRGAGRFYPNLVNAGLY